jgi:hypothetical protein
MSLLIFSGRKSNFLDIERISTKTIERAFVDNIFSIPRCAQFRVEMHIEADAKLWWNT